MFYVFNYLNLSLQGNDIPLVKLQENAAIAKLNFWHEIITSLATKIDADIFWNHVTEFGELAKGLEKLLDLNKNIERI